MSGNSGRWIIFWGLALGCDVAAAIDVGHGWRLYGSCITAGLAVAFLIKSAIGIARES
jgi:hypothetical protein